MSRSESTDPGSPIVRSGIQQNALGTTLKLGNKIRYLTTILEQDSTNPLTLAMVGDTSSAEGDTSSAELIKKMIGRENGRIEDQKTAYENDDSYWQHVEKLVEDTQKENMDKGNEEKANMIEEKLNSILTNDKFLILVYDHCEGTHRHAFHRIRHNQMIISNKNLGNCNVVVYRSLRWNTVSSEHQNRLKAEIENHSDGRIPWSGNYEEFLAYINGKFVKNAGLLAIVREDRNIAIRPKTRGDFPGAFATVTAGNENDNAKYILFAGFD